jgi:hypothetical protein
MPFADIGAPLCVSSNCLALSTGHMMTRLAHARHIHLPTLTSARFAVDTRLMLAASIRLPAHTSILTLVPVHEATSSTQSFLLASCQPASPLSPDPFWLPLFACQLADAFSRSACCSAESAARRARCAARFAASRASLCSGVSRASAARRQRVRCSRFRRRTCTFLKGGWAWSTLHLFIYCPGPRGPPSMTGMLRVHVWLGYCIVN